MKGLSTDTGPVSGGTKVTITGQNVNIGADRKVTMIFGSRAPIDCDIISRYGCL